MAERNRWLKVIVLAVVVMALVVARVVVMWWSPSVMRNGHRTTRHRRWYAEYGIPMRVPLATEYWAYKDGAANWIFEGPYENSIRMGICEFERAIWTVG